MLAYILALGVGLGSFALYMAAFFFPEVHRKSDFIWSGIGLFYALVLWVCAGRITGGVLLGQTASVALLGWFGWQTLKLRWDYAPGQKTQLPSSLNLGALQEKLTDLTSSEGLSGVKGQATRLFSTVKDRVQSGASTPAGNTPGTASASGATPEVTTKPAASGAGSNPLASVTGLVDTAKQAIAKVSQLGKKQSRPTIVLNHPPKDAEAVDAPDTVESASEDDFDDIETPPTPSLTSEPAIASASTVVDVDDDDDRTELLPPRESVPFTATTDVIPAEEEDILNNTVPVSPEVAEQLEQPTELTESGEVADSTSVAEPEPAVDEEPVAKAPVTPVSEAPEVVENPLGAEFVPAEAAPVDAAEIDLAPPAEPPGAGDPIERQLEEPDLNAPPIEPATYTMVEPDEVEQAIAASEAASGTTPELKAPNPFFEDKNQDSSKNPEA